MIVIGGCHGSGNHAVSYGLSLLGISMPGPYSGEYVGAYTSDEITERPTLHNNGYINHQTAGVCWKVLSDLVDDGMGSAVPPYKALLEYDISIMDPVPDINWCNPRFPAIAPVLRERADGFVLIRREMDKLLNSSMKSNVNFLVDPEKLVRAYSACVRRTAEDFDIPFIETWYEDWYKNDDPDKIRKVVRFCNPGISPGDDEIRKALERLTPPSNF